MSTALQFVTPVARVVMGDLYTLQTKDSEGKLRVVKQGPNAGQPAPVLFFAIAIPKTQQHWANEAWGTPIWTFAHQQWPRGESDHPDFAWKIGDGDSTIKTRRGAGSALSEREGCKGHWIIFFNSSYAPKIYNNNGTEQFIEKDRVKCGHYVQVAVSVKSNEASANPGIYMNPQMISFQAFGAEIVTGPDATAVGFGQGVVLPAGASAAPLGGFNPAPPAGPATVAGPPVNAPYSPGSMPAAGPAYTPPPVQQPIVPNPQFLQAGAPGMVAPGVMPMPGAPVVMPLAPPVSTRRMTAAAGAYTYEQLIAGGWTDQTLVAQGLMTL